MCQDDLLSGKSVLLVEGESHPAEHILGLLKTLGCGTVVPATSLGEAEISAAADHFDLALLEVNLPNGTQAVQFGRCLSAKGVRIVFMSGFNPKDTARATRGFEFIEKPVSLSRLKAALQRAILRAPADTPRRSGQRIAR